MITEGLVGYLLWLFAPPIHCVLHHVPTHFGLTINVHTEIYFLIRLHLCGWVEFHSTNGQYDRVRISA